MIVILKRNDLSQEHREQAAKDLELDHFGLSADLIDQAELIVFVEGSDVRILKHLPGFQSKDNFDVLIRYITTQTPTEHKPFSKKRVRPLRKTDWIYWF